MKEVFKEIQETCHNQNFFFRSALQILKTTLRKSMIDGGSPSLLSDVNFSAKTGFGGLNQVQLFTFQGSVIQPADFQTKSQWCVH